MSARKQPADGVPTHPTPGAVQGAHLPAAGPGIWVSGCSMQRHLLGVPMGCSSGRSDIQAEGPGEEARLEAPVFPWNLKPETGGHCL